MNPTFDMTCEYCNQLWNSKHHCVASDLAARIRIVEAKLKLAEEALDVIARSWAVGHECAAQERARTALSALRSDDAELRKLKD